MDLDKWIRLQANAMKAREAVVGWYIQRALNHTADVTVDLRLTIVVTPQIVSVEKILDIQQRGRTIR